MALTNEAKLSLVSTFDLMDNAGQDYACSLVSQDKGKRLRDVTDEDVLTFHKELMKSVFSEKCDAEIQYGFLSSVNLHHYRTNRDDQINFIGQYLLMQSDSTIDTVYWTTEDAGPVPLTRDEFFQVYKEALMHKNDSIKKYWLKKQEVDASTDHMGLRVIDWDTETQPAATPGPGDTTTIAPSSDTTSDTTTDASPTVDPAPEEQPVAQASIEEEQQKKPFFGLF